MRIKLKKGKQKELINKVKNKNQFTWNDFSKFLNVSEVALIDWSKERNLMPLKVYKKLDPDNKYKKYILEIKKKNGLLYVVRNYTFWFDDFVDGGENLQRIRARSYFQVREINWCQRSRIVRDNPLY